jgi:hypothetical protein
VERLPSTRSRIFGAVLRAFLLLDLMWRQFRSLKKKKMLKMVVHATTLDFVGVWPVTSQPQGSFFRSRSSVEKRRFWCAIGSSLMLVLLEFRKDFFVICFYFWTFL